MHLIVSTPTQPAKHDGKPPEHTQTCLQVIGPIYKLVSTDVGGERRFAAAVARRLQSLGALTRGDRRAASGVDLSESNFDSPLGRKSLRRVLKRRAHCKVQSVILCATACSTKLPLHLAAGSPA